MCADTMLILETIGSQLVLDLVGWAKVWTSLFQVLQCCGECVCGNDVSLNVKFI